MENGLGRHRVLAHRGFWNPNLLENSLEAFQKAVEYGFGIETDIRNDSSGVWVAHDAIHLNNKLRAESLLDLGSPIALNIKSDGLNSFGISNVSRIRSSNSFFFDGSIPQMLNFKRNNIPHALRLSEFERSLPWTPNYIWLDAFETDWWLDDLGIFDMFSDLDFVIVSPELHGRSPEAVWTTIYRMTQSKRSRVMICTDRPTEFLSWE